MYYWRTPKNTPNKYRGIQYHTQHSLDISYGRQPFHTLFCHTQHSLDISYGRQPFHTFFGHTQPMLSKACAPRHVLSICAGALHIQCVCCGAQTMLCNAWRTQHISLHRPCQRNKHSALRHWRTTCLCTVANPRHTFAMLATPASVSAANLGRICGVRPPGVPSAALAASAACVASSD